MSQIGHHSANGFISQRWVNTLETRFAQSWNCSMSESCAAQIKLHALIRTKLSVVKNGLSQSQRNTVKKLKRVTTGGDHLRSLAPGQYSAEETLQGWRAVGGTLSNITARKLYLRPSTSIAMSLNTTPTGHLKTPSLHCNCTSNYENKSKKTTNVAYHS